MIEKPGDRDFDERASISALREIGHGIERRAGKVVRRLALYGGIPLAVGLPLYFVFVGIRFAVFPIDNTTRTILENSARFAVFIAVVWLVFRGRVLARWSDAAREARSWSDTSASIRKPSEEELRDSRASAQGQRKWLLFAIPFGLGVMAIGGGLFCMMALIAGGSVISYRTVNRALRPRCTGREGRR